MAAAPAFDDLMRAAEAAGFAMASLEDDPAQSMETVALPHAVSAEDSARGARRVSLSAAATEQSSAAGSMVPKTVKSSATSVRDTVYGYLGLGVPA